MSIIKIIALLKKAKQNVIFFVAKKNYLKKIVFLCNTRRDQ